MTAEDVQTRNLASLHRLRVRIEAQQAKRRAYQAQAERTGDLRHADRAADLDGPIDKAQRRYFRALLKGRRY